MCGKQNPVLCDYVWLADKIFSLGFISYAFIYIYRKITITPIIIKMIMFFVLSNIHFKPRLFTFFWRIKVKVLWSPHSLRCHRHCHCHLHAKPLRLAKTIKLRHPQAVLLLCTSRTPLNCLSLKTNLLTAFSKVTLQISLCWCTKLTYIFQPILLFLFQISFSIRAVENNTG